MNLLLLLSALLSALTGAVPGVRRTEMPQAVAQGLVATKAGRVAVAKATTRPAATLATPVTVADAAPLHVRLPVAISIWKDRRRE